MPKKISAWQCQFCSRYRINKRSITRHEEICFRNPSRKVLPGEMAIWETIPRELTYWDNYGVPQSDWQEVLWEPPAELSSKYKWWPRDEDGCIGLGYIFINNEWVKMEGYEEPRFAPGYSWRDEIVPQHYYDVQWNLRHPENDEWS